MEVLISALKPTGGNLVDGLLHLESHQNGVGVSIFGIEIVGILSCYELDVILLCNLYEIPVCNLLLGKGVSLKLYV